ncbi:MAG: AraC family transcriptional regulator [Fibrobacteria bacterium]|jgi:AraC-like DNA-binding protein|nr:AraC family transcriptional regulator [Fibrobacteria bacterium]
MDVLTDILNSAGLRKSLLVSHAFHSPWAMKLPCNQSMGFHIVTYGEAYIRAPRFDAPLRLERGDVVLIRRGFDHVVSTDRVTEAPTALRAGPFPVPEDTDVPPLAVVTCGLYQFQTEPIHPLFAELPEMIVIRSNEIPAHSPLNVAQQLLSAELAQGGEGSEAVVKALLDVMFHYILRNWLEREGVNREGAGEGRWSRALRDPHLHRAIEAMHAHPERDWNLEELAERAGLSRAAFAQRFKKLASDTPGHYLARLRIQRAMDLLRATDDNLDAIAERVGYGDPFVFSKAFKRIQGVSPREFKKQLLAA